MSISDVKGSVLVTGATGFVAGNLIHKLLDGNYMVYGSVQDLNQARYLYDINRDHRENFHLIQASIEDPLIWDTIMIGIDFVVHTATPTDRHQYSTDQEFINTAVKGTRNIMNAALKNGVKKFIFMSCLDTIVLGHPKHKKMYDEQDWAIIDSNKNPVSLYVKSKYFAEKEAWSINFDNQNKMEFIVLNPGLIFGTRQKSLQPIPAEHFMINLMKNSYLFGLPKLKIGIADVWDVVQAVIKSIELAKLDSQRFIISSQTVWLRDIAQILAAEFNNKGYNIKTSQASHGGLYFAKLFSHDLREIYPYTERNIYINNQNSIQILQMEYTDIKDTIVSMAYNLIVEQKVSNSLKKFKYADLNERRKKLISIKRIQMMKQDLISKQRRDLEYQEQQGNQKLDSITKSVVNKA